MPKKKPVSKAQPKKVVPLKQGGAKKKTFAFDSDDSGPKVFFCLKLTIFNYYFLCLKSKM